MFEKAIFPLLGFQVCQYVNQERVEDVPYGFTGEYNARQRKSALLQIPLYGAVSSSANTYLIRF